MKYLFSILVIAALVFSGCATSTTGKLTQTEGVVIPAVNAAMGTWKAYVTAGKASQAQINAVQAAYNVYYTAQLAAEAALITATANGSTNTLDATTASAAVTTAETSLINLINQYAQ